MPLVIRQATRNVPSEDLSQYYFVIYDSEGRTAEGHSMVNTHGTWIYEDESRLPIFIGEV